MMLILLHFGRTPAPTGNQNLGAGLGKGLGHPVADARRATGD